jgi:hypothetical protein
LVVGLLGTFPRAAFDFVFFFLLHEPLQACSLGVVFYMGSEDGASQQNMAGCCMSIYDIWHGHVHLSRYHNMAEIQVSKSTDVLRWILHLHLVVAA